MKPEPNDPTQSGTFHPATPARLSRNEIESLCTKAARGAGMSWGMAEEAGFAAGWLSEHGLDGPAALLAQLTAEAGKAWRDLAPEPGPGQWRAASGGRLCPIALGATLGDHCGLPEAALKAGLTLGPVGRPVLLLPFLAGIATRLGCGVTLKWEGSTLRLDGRGAMAGDLTDLAALQAATLTLAADAAPLAGTARGAAQGCDAATLAGLNALAMQTTVPPSKQSRAGAGSAGSDNE